MNEPVKTQAGEAQPKHHCLIHRAALELGSERDTGAERVAWNVLPSGKPEVQFVEPVSWAAAESVYPGC